MSVQRTPSSVTRAPADLQTITPSKSQSRGQKKSRSKSKSRTTPSQWFSSSPLSAPPTSPRKKLSVAAKQPSLDPESEYDEIAIRAVRSTRTPTQRVHRQLEDSDDFRNNASDLDDDFDGGAVAYTGTSTSRTPVTRNSVQTAYQVVSGGETDESDPEPYELEPDGPIEEGAEGVYEVEAILDKQGRGRSALYKIRWKGYGPEHDTWEPQSHINAVELLDEFERDWERKTKGKRKRTTSGSSDRVQPQAISQQTRPDARTPRPIKSAQSVERAHRKGRHTLQMHIPIEQFFYNRVYQAAEEFLLPMATVLCEPAWEEQIQVLLEEANIDPGRQTQAVVLHPATLVILRTSSSPSERTFAKRKKDVLARVLPDIAARRVPLLGNIALPEDSLFRNCAIHDIISGGEGYRLTWGEGLPDGINDEFGNLLACAMHLEEVLPDKRIRVVVRKVKKNLQAACDYFGVELVDIFGLWEELTGATDAPSL